MSYITGTVSTTTPATSLVATLETTMLINSWTKVSANVTSGNNQWNVYKSPGVSNNIGNDFYVALGWDTASNSYFGATIFEGWNSAANTANNYYPAGSGSIYQYTFAANGAFLTSVQTGNSNNQILPQYVMTTSAINDNTMSLIVSQQLPTSGQGGLTYYASITVDRIIVGFGNTSTITSGSNFYIGSFDSAQSLTNDPYPLGVFNITGNQQATDQTIGTAGGFTRAPSANAGTYNYALSAAFNDPVNVLPTNVGDPYLSSKNIVSKLYVEQSQSYWKRGILKDLYVCYIQCQRGDTITWVYGGTTYTATCISNGSGSTQKNYFTSQV